MPVSRKKADVLVKKGGTLVSPEPAPQPIDEGKLFSKDEIKSIMVEAIKIASNNERRSTSRLTVNRDERGFILTVDISPVGIDTSRLN